MTDGAEEIRTLLRLHRPAEALDVARRLLASDPDRADVLVLCGTAHLQLEQYEDALAVAERGCAAHPALPWMHQVRGRALGGLGRHREAVAALEEAVRLDPTGTDHLETLAEELVDFAYAMPGRSTPHTDRAIDRAAQLADRARSLAPHDASTHFVRAKVHIARMEWDAAAECARRGLTIEPESALGHQLAGVAAAKNRDMARAGDHLVTAGRADPRSTSSIRLLRTLTSRSTLWITVAVLLGVPALAWIDGTWSGAMWVVVAVGVGLAIWILWDTRGDIGDDARSALRRSKRLD